MTFLIVLGVVALAFDRWLAERFLDRSMRELGDRIAHRSRDRMMP